MQITRFTIALVLMILVPLFLTVDTVVGVSILLLVMSLRLARRERIDPGGMQRVKLSVVAASIAIAILFLSGSKIPLVMVASLTMLAAVVILQAQAALATVRRAFLTISLIAGTWLVLANLYAVNGRISRELTAEPGSALLLLGLVLTLGLTDTGNGLVPDSLIAVLGEKASARLLASAIAVPLLLGCLRLELEHAFALDKNSLLALHVLGTLLVLGILLVTSMRIAHRRILAQHRTQTDFEATEGMLRALLEESSEFYLAMNLAGRIVAANENARRCFALPDLRKKVVCIEDLIVSESHELMRKLPETLLRGVSASMVLQFRQANGERVELEVTTACRMDQGAPSEIVIVGRSLQVQALMASV